MAESSLSTKTPVSTSPSTLTEEEIQRFHGVPTRPLSWPFRILFGLASIVTGLCNVTIKQLLLPSQVGHIDPANKVTTFALIAVVGAVAGVITAPLAGAISDRMTLRWGRRRPWLVFGAIMGAIGLVLMALATNIPQLLVGEVVVQIAVDSIMSAMTAIIPDQVPLKQRAVASAFIGMSPIVGGLIGLLLVTRLTDAVHHPQTGYYILAVATIVVVGLFLIVLRDPQLPRELVPAFNFREFLSGFWVNPRKYPDFGFTLLSRSLLFLGYTILITYLLYYLQDVIHYQGADQGVAIFQVVSTLLLVASAIIGGIFADKLQRLKPFIIAAALIMTAALLLLSFVPKWPAVMAGGAIVGIGFGIYLSVDLALAVKVLPAARSRAKDLGLINTAIFTPLILSPIIGALVLNTTHSYLILFAIAAASFFCAALAILPIKSVR